MKIEILESERINTEHEISSHLVQCTSGVRYAWYQNTAPVLCGEHRDVNDDALSPFPAHLTHGQCATVTRHWPAWLATELACLELGSRVLILGHGRLAESISNLCRMRGSTEHVQIGENDSEAGSDEWKHRLRFAPDAIIILPQRAELIPAALSISREKGNIVFIGTEDAPVIDMNTYPDLHRRGLQTVMVRLDHVSSEALAIWHRALNLIPRAFEK